MEKEKIKGSLQMKTEIFFSKLNDVEQIMVMLFVNNHLKIPVFVNQNNFKYVNYNYLESNLRKQKSVEEFKKSLTEKGREAFDNIVEKAKQFLLEEVWQIIEEKENILKYKNHSFCADKQDLKEFTFNELVIIKNEIELNSI